MHRLSSTGDLETRIRRQLHRIDMTMKLPWSTGAKPYLDLIGTSCTDGWLVRAQRFCPTTQVYLVTDNRDLQSRRGQVCAWAQPLANGRGLVERTVTLCRSIWRTHHIVFVHISADTGLHKVHPTWAGTYILDACVFLFPTINFALIDSDCVPVTLFEIRELWLASTDPTLQLAPSKSCKKQTAKSHCIIAQTCALCGHGQGYAATWPTIKAVQIA